MLYDFKCQNCGYEEEDVLVSQFISYFKKLICPKCEKKEFVRKVVKNNFKINDNKKESNND